MCALYSWLLFPQTSFSFYYLQHFFQRNAPQNRCFWYPGAEAAPVSWCLLGHHVTESVYPVTFKGTFEPILARFNIHMRHLTSSSHFVKWCGNVRLSLALGSSPPSLVEENGAVRQEGVRTPLRSRTEPPPSTATHDILTKYHFYYLGVLNSMIYSII